MYKHPLLSPLCVAHCVCSGMTTWSPMRAPLEETGPPSLSSRHSSSKGGALGDFSIHARSSAGGVTVQVSLRFHGRSFPATYRRHSLCRGPGGLALTPFFPLFSPVPSLSLGCRVMLPPFRSSCLLRSPATQPVRISHR